MKWISERPPIAVELLPSIAPDLKDLRSGKNYSKITIHKELEWAGACLGEYVTNLRVFQDAADEFRRRFLLSAYEDADKSLRRIEEHSGQSVWLIKHKILLLQAWKGLDAQKQYSNSLWKSRSKVGIADCVGCFTSIRNEPSISMGRFHTQADDWLSTLDGAIHDYMHFQLLPGRKHSTLYAANVLRVAQSSSLVDLYDSVCALVVPLLLANDDALTESLCGTVLPIVESLGDRRIAGVGSLLVKDGHRHAAASEVLKATDLMLEGRAAEAADLALSALSIYPDDPDLFMLSARALACAPSVAVQDPICVQEWALSLGRALRRTKSYPDDYSDLHKAAVNLFGSSISVALLGVLQENSRSSIRATTIFAYDQIAALSSPVLHPFWFPSIYDPDIRMGLAEVAAKRWPSGPAHDLALNWCSKGLPGTRRATPDFLLASLERSALAEEFEALSDNATIASRFVTAYHRNRAMRLVCNALIDEDRLANAVSLLAAAYISDRMSGAMLPVNRLCVACVGSHPIPFAPDISVPILFDIYSQHVGRQFDAQRVFAYQAFLMSHKVDKPSQLVSRRSEFDHDKFVYFLRYVAVESTLDRSRAIRSSKAVLEERQAICRHLVELDPQSANVYYGELRTLLRRSMLQKRMREVEQRKIYVDVDSFKRHVRSLFKESYTRYQDLLREHPDETLEPSYRLLSTIRNLIDTEYGLSLELHLPDMPATDLLTEIVFGMRDEFVTSPEHGLDKYLSVRIRHGTLVSHLRRPLDTYHLITPKNASKGTYRNNDYWRERLSPGVAAQVEPRLHAMSASVDQALEELVAAVQVSTKNSGTCFFPFVISTEDIAGILLSHTAAPVAFEDFVGYMIGRFNLTLDRNLESARATIQHDWKTRLSGILDTLDTELSGGDGPAELIDAVRRARGELRLAVDRVAEWFQRTDAVGDEPFLLGEAIDICSEAVTELRLEQRIHDSAVGLRLKGDALFAFFDVFFIVFENIAKHSGYEAHPRATVTVSAVNEGRASILISNPMEAEVMTSEAMDRVKRIKAEMSGAEHQRFVRIEGGSGFHKLKRILNHEFGDDSDLSFGFVGKDRFDVTVSVPLGAVRDEGTTGRG